MTALVIAVALAVLAAIVAAIWRAAQHGLFRRPTGRHRCTSTPATVVPLYTALQQQTAREVAA